jgi:hypothetical protein
MEEAAARMSAKKLQRLRKVSSSRLKLYHKLRGSAKDGRRRSTDRRVPSSASRDCLWLFAFSLRQTRFSDPTSLYMHETVYPDVE